MRGQAVLEILLTLKDQASKGFDKAKKGLKGFAEGLSKVRDVALAGAAAIAAVGGATIALIEQAVAFERSKVALEGYTGSAEEAVRWIDAIQASTNGALDAMSATAAATRFASMGLANTSEEAAKFADIAVTLGATMGKGPQQAIEEFSLMLANQAILRLDTFGISGAAVRDRMNSLADEGIAVADRQTRFLLATLEEAEGKMGALEEAGFVTTNSLERFQAKLQDTKLGIGTFLAEGLLPIIDGFESLQNALNDQVVEVALASESYEQYGEEIRKTAARYRALSEEEFNAIKREQELREAVEQGKGTLTGWESNLRGVADAAGAAAANMEGIVLSTQKLTEATLGAQAMDQLNTALSEGRISAEEYETHARAVMENFLDMSPSEVDAAITVRDLNTAFAEGKIDVREYHGGMVDLRTEIDRLESKEVEIVVRTRYETEGDGRGDRYQTGGQFQVFGPPGPDRIPFGPVHLTSGETVTVTPAGHRAPGMNGKGGGGGVNFFGPVNIGSREDEDVFFERLRRMVT